MADMDITPGKGGEAKGDGGLILPLARVRKVIKAEGDIKMISGEASFLIARATELFLENFAAKVGQEAGKGGVTYADVANFVSEAPEMEFIQDFVPKKVKMSEVATILKAQDAGVQS